MAQHPENMMVSERLVLPKHGGGVIRQEALHLLTARIDQKIWALEDPR
jgi:hypothetical protein